MFFIFKVKAAEVHHTPALLIWLELTLSQIDPHTYQKDKHCQGIYFPQEAVHYWPKTTNIKKKKALGATRTDSQNSISPSPREQSKAGPCSGQRSLQPKRIFYGIP